MHSYDKVLESQGTLSNGLLGIRGGDEIVVGIDPGQTTGVAVFKTCGEFVKGREFPDLDTDEGLQRFLGWIDKVEYLSCDIKTFFVCEDFIIQPYKATSMGWSSVIASEVIGAIKAQFLDNITFQQPAIKQAHYLQDEYMPDYDVFATKNLPHMVDAARHAIYYMLGQDGMGRHIRSAIVRREMEEVAAPDIE